MRHVIVIAVAVVSLAAGALAGEKITLKQRYQPGSYVWEMKTDMKMTMDMGQPQPMAQNMKMLMAAQMVVGPMTEKGQQFRVTYKRIRQEIKNPMMSMSYDSALPAAQQNPMLAGLLQAMLNKQIVVTLDAEGKTKNVVGMDKIWDAMGRGNPAAAGAMQNMKSQFSDETMKQMFSQADQFLPNKPVAVGEKWQVASKQTIPMIGEASVTNDCVLKDVKKVKGAETAIIDFVGTFVAAEGQQIKPLPGASIKFEKMDMKTSGTMNLDVRTGMMTASTMKQKGNIKMAVNVSQDQQMNMSIDLDGTTAITVTPGVYKPTTTKPADKTRTAAPKAAGD